MNSVHILEEWVEHEGSTIIGVYSNKFLAEQDREKLPKDTDYVKYKIVEMELNKMSSFYDRLYCHRVVLEHPFKGNYTKEEIRDAIKRWKDGN